MRAVSVRDGDGCLAQQKQLLGRAQPRGRIRPSPVGTTSWLSLGGDRWCSEVLPSPWACTRDRPVWGGRSLRQGALTSLVYATTTDSFCSDSIRTTRYDTTGH